MMKKSCFIVVLISVTLVITPSLTVFGAERFNPNAPSSYTCRQFIEDADGFGIGSDRVIVWTHGYITGKFGAESAFPFESAAIQRVLTHVVDACKKNPERAYLTVIDTMFDSGEIPSAYA